MKKEIDLNTYERKDNYKYFQSLEAPFIVITEMIDITDWYHHIKEKGYPFYLSFQYLIGNVANSIPEFRQRIVNGKIYEYDSCGCSYTVALENGKYCYNNVETDMDFNTYLTDAKQSEQQAKAMKELKEVEDPDRYFFLTCLPWIHFTSLTVPFGNKEFSNPCITLGKFEKKNEVEVIDGQMVVKERIVLPVALQVNHSLMDGSHVARFYQELKEKMKEM